MIPWRCRFLYRGDGLGGVPLRAREFEFVWHICARHPNRVSRRVACCTVLRSTCLSVVFCCLLAFRNLRATCARRRRRRSSKCEVSHVSKLEKTEKSSDSLHERTKVFFVGAARPAIISGLIFSSGFSSQRTGMTRHPQAPSHRWLTSQITH